MKLLCGTVEGAARCTVDVGVVALASACLRSASPLAVSFSSRRSAGRRLTTNSTSALRSLSGDKNLSVVNGAERSEGWRSAPAGTPSPNVSNVSLRERAASPLSAPAAAPSPNVSLRERAASPLVETSCALMAGRRGASFLSSERLSPSALPADGDAGGVSVAGAVAALLACCSAPCFAKSANGFTVDFAGCSFRIDRSTTMVDSFCCSIFCSNGADNVVVGAAG